MITFISHSKKDVNVAREIALFLVAEKVSVWYDEWEVSAGDSIVKKVNDGLEDTATFIILWSVNSSRSNWVRKELDSIMARAIENKELKIIPILLDETPLPALLSDLKYIRYQSGTEQDRSSIVHAVIGRASENNYIKAVVKKYHELVRSDPSDDHPFSLKACPECGSTRIKHTQAFDHQKQDVYYIANCPECNWTDWSQ